MRCAWKELLAILPASLRNEINNWENRNIQELRLRINAPPEIVISGEQIWLRQNTSQDDLNFVVNAASRYSPWCAATSKEGYITAPGGHRIGLCGTAICKNDAVEGIQSITSLCIRVDRDFAGIAKNIKHLRGSILILGAPAWGKTTLLRDLIRLRAEKETICVVDERGELFPDGFQPGKCMDILKECPKAKGIEMLLRTMGPDTIAVDEITGEKDCQALAQAANCGVFLLATAHAGSIDEFRTKPLYRPLLEQNIFNYLVMLHQDKSYHWERMSKQC